MFNISNYKAYHSNRVYDKWNRRGRGGGVGVYIHSTLNSTLMHEEWYDNNNYVVCQILQLNLFIIGIYKPPNKLIEEEKRFIDKIDAMLSNYKNCIVMGDFNIDLLNDKNEIMRLYVDKITLQGFGVLNNIHEDHYTRICSTTKTIIDHAFTDKFEWSYELLVNDFDLSDHRYILLSINTDKTYHTAKKASTMDILNYQSLECDTLWDNVACVKNFAELIDDLELLVRRNKKTISINHNKSQPWVTIELKNKIKERNKFFRYKVKYKGDQYVEQQYKLLKKETSRLNKTLKKEYYETKLMSNIHDPKKFWKFLKYATYNVEESEKNAISIEKNGVLIKDNNMIPNYFNDHFTSIGHSIVSKLSTNNEVLPQYTITSAFELRKIDQESVETIIKSLKTNAACGYYNISTKFIQRFIDKLSPIVTRLINNSIDKREFPDVLKIGKITPVFKSGKSNDVNNYRPIYTLSGFSKIFETYLNTLLKGHFSQNHIISNNQYGFVDKSNTTVACSELMHFVSSVIDRKMYCACVFLDISKAFDTMNHSILIKKLSSVGIGEEDLKIFQSYMMNRKQAVFVNNTYSSMLISYIGVPQGSNLGPLLFIFFINDICNLQLEGAIQLFADDICVKYKAESIDELISKMQHDMYLLEEWFNRNKLILNSKKSKILIFNNRRFDHEPKIYYQSQELEIVKTYKYLGLTINYDLKWDSHIDSIKSKISPYIFAIQRLKDILPKSALKMIYFSYVHSHIIYLNPIWSGASLQKLNELYIYQKRAIKYILNVNRMYPTKKLFEKDFRSLNFVIKEQLLIFTFKVTHNMIKHNYEPNLRNTIHTYSTRGSREYDIAFFFTNMRHHNVLYKGLMEYNKLPEELKNATNLLKFKKGLRVHLDSWWNFSNDLLSSK